ncbi:MAG: ankyrin repeat domain-containing protein [Treponemataceae bacterium]
MKKFAFVMVLGLLLCNSILALTKNEERFLAASRSGDMKAINKLIGKVNIDVQDDDGYTALMHAVAKKNSWLFSVLLDANADVNIVTPRGDSALILALYFDNEDFATLLVEKKANLEQALFFFLFNEEKLSYLIGVGANVNTVDSAVLTPLMLAAEKPSESIVRLLLKAEADVNVLSSDKETALMFAVEKNSPSIVALLLEVKADVNAVNSAGKSALMLAVEKKSEPIVSLLLTVDVDINIVNFTQENALMLAVEKASPAIVSLLVGANADINAVNSAGKSALMLAVEKKSDKIVSLLLDAKADVNKADKSGKTPLILALSTKNVSIAEMLLKENALLTEADINTFDSSAVFKWAVTDGHPLIVKALQNAKVKINTKDFSFSEALVAGLTDIVKLFIDDGVDIDREVSISGYRYEYTPLVLASAYGHADIVKMLLDAGADVGSRKTSNRCDYYENGEYQQSPPLIEASENGHTDIVRLLIKAKANIDRRSLLVSAANGHTDIVTLLLDAGGDINAGVNGDYDEYNTPLIVASANGHTETAKLLVARGAKVNIIRKGGDGGTA